MVDRVIVLGLDGATFDLIEPWIQEGYLPNMARVMTQGPHGRLASVIPPISAHAWTSFATGKNAGKHGIYDFYHFDPVKRRINFPNTRSRHASSIWQLLSGAGYRVGVMNMPLTYPPEEVNGFVISGFDTPGMQQGDYTYPRSLKAELSRTIGEYLIEAPFNVSTDGYVAHWHRAVDQRVAAMHYLLDRHQPHLMIVVFMATDRLQHYFWRDMDPRHPAYDPASADRYGTVILDIYRRLDEVIGEILDIIGEQDVLVVMSDHGGGGQSNKIVHLNRLLEDLGLLQFVSTDRHSSLRPLIERSKTMLFKGIHFGRVNVVARIPPWLKNRVSGSTLFQRFRARAEAGMYLSNIDWPRTLAYSEEERPYVWLNLKGREPDGVVEPGDEYERLRQHIIQQLVQVRDPETDESVVERIYRREDLFSGEYSHHIPDLIVKFRDDPYCLMSKPSALAKGTTWISSYPTDEYNTGGIPLVSGNHRPNGILMLSGRGIAGPRTLEGAHIVDLAPTLLYLFGQPVPEDMDGQIVWDALEPEFVKEHPVRYREADSAPHLRDDQDGYTDEERRQIEATLQRLGYLD